MTPIYQDQIEAEAYRASAKRAKLKRRLDTALDSWMARFVDWLPAALMILCFGTVAGVVAIQIVAAVSHIDSQERQATQAHHTHDRSNAMNDQRKNRHAGPLPSLQNVIIFSARDWSKSPEDAWIYGILVGWDDESLSDISAKHGWHHDDALRLKRLHRQLLQGATHE